MERGRKRSMVGSVLATTVVALLCALATPAGAQDDPYGGTTTTAGSVAGAQATCDLTITEGEVGAGVTATVAGVVSETTVRILFGGVEVGRAATPAQGQSGAALAIPFVVPDVSPGDYLVTAVGPDFTSTCETEVGGMFTVLGARLGRGAGAGGGALPRTGIYVALFLVLALVLLLVGRALVEASRRRRRATDGGPPAADRADAHHLRRPVAK